MDQTTIKTPDSGSFSLLSLFSGIAIFVLDQVSKYIVITQNIPFIYNDGVAFSLPLTNTFSLIVSLILIILLILFGQRLYTGIHITWFRLSLGLVVGGAISNLIDRLTNPGVIDFIKIPYWPTFNLADVGVSFGIGIMMVLLYQEQKNSSNKV